MRERRGSLANRANELVLAVEFELIVALLGLILFFIVVQAIKFFPALPAHPHGSLRPGGE